MAQTENEMIREMSYGAMPNVLHGRRQIYTSHAEITRGNVVDVLQKAMNVHGQNREEERYLANYIRGIQPILLREKKVNGEINNKVVVNVAN